MTEPRSEQDWFTHFLEARGVNPGTECKQCSGLGVRLYGSTSTWHGGIGGAMMTYDTCNKCWGSGSNAKPGMNLKQVTAWRGELQERRAKDEYHAACVRLAEVVEKKLTHEHHALWCESRSEHHGPCDCGLQEAFEALAEVEQASE